MSHQYILCNVERTSWKVLLYSKIIKIEDKLFDLGFSFLETIEIWNKNQVYTLLPLNDFDEWISDINEHSKNPFFLF